MNEVRKMGVYAMAKRVVYYRSIGDNFAMTIAIEALADAVADEMVRRTEERRLAHQRARLRMVA
jgi:hypothetical protein